MGGISESLETTAIQRGSLVVIPGVVEGRLETELENTRVYRAQSKLLGLYL